jgi:hypothetical protein
MTHPEYVLVQPPHDGCIHASTPTAVVWGGGTYCGDPVLGTWRLLRSYRSRAITRKRVTCGRCRIALSATSPTRRNGNE